MKHPFVSVIIPAYNRAWSIRRAVDSVLKQSEQDFELIVVDDGSDDNTLEQLKPYHRNLRIISQPNLGVSAARNAGIKKSCGQYICFLDSDDEWLPHKLKAQMNFFEKRPDYLICQTVERWIRDGRFVNIPDIHKKVPDFIFPQSLKKCIITASSVMIKRELLNEIGLFNESIPACEDYDLWLRIVWKYPVGLINQEHLIRYGGHQDQLSSKYHGNDKYRIRSILNLLESFPLSDDQRQLAIQELNEKCKIYANGCRKRERYSEAERFSEIPSAYLETV